jgi:hypothetical protein
MNTAPDSGKVPVVHTGTACLAEWRLVSKPYHQLPLRLFRRCSCLLSAENACFKWHYFVNNNRVWVHPLFRNKRNKSGEYHHVFGALKRLLTKFFEYFRVSADTFDYILSKVHDSLECQTSTGLSASTYMNHKRPAAPRLCINSLSSDRTGMSNMHSYVPF